jgi:hypothetical protein
MVGEGFVEEGHVGGAYMGIAGGRRGDSKADFVGHFFPLLLIAYFTCLAVSY